MTELEQIVRRAYAAGEERRRGTWEEWWDEIGRGLVEGYRDETHDKYELLDRGEI